MPQGRSKAFSGKKKKLQMQQKRSRTPNSVTGETPSHVPKDTDEIGNSSIIIGTAAADRRALLSEDTVNLGARSGTSREKFDLRFRKETKEELAKMRESARAKAVPARGAELEVGFRQYFPAGLDFPRRPPWNRDMPKAILECRENESLVNFVSDALRDHGDDVGHFELNLETWRQLWRVVEMSDVLLLVVDSRYPAAMCPPSLYSHLKSAGKDMIVVLNKVDLVPLPVAIAWKHSLLEAYPGIRVTFFTSCPSYNLMPGTGLLAESSAGGAKLQTRRLRGRISMVTEGAQQVFEACKGIVAAAGADVELETWLELIRKADRHSGHEGDAASEDAQEEGEKGGEEEERYLEDPNQRFRDRRLTIGMVGQPNAGKSSLINSLVGRRVVSVSKTPGHTKHFQTINVTRSVRLCDCPGLVFPSTAPKPLQVVMGSYPISQLREMFSVLQYVARRINLPEILKLSHPDEDSENPKWSAFTIAEAWAAKRGYVTARSNRPDLNRSSNHLLRMTLDGKIPLHILPKGFHESGNRREGHEDTEALRRLLGLDDSRAKECSVGGGDDFGDFSDADSEEGEEMVGTGEDEDGDEVASRPAKTLNRFTALNCEGDDD